MNPILIVTFTGHKSLGGELMGMGRQRERESRGRRELAEVNCSIGSYYYQWKISAYTHEVGRFGEWKEPKKVVPRALSDQLKMDGSVS